MPTALPNLTLNITPPGGSPTNYANNLAYRGAYQQIGIEQNFGRQGDTATIVLVDDWQGRATPNFYIPVDSTISLIDNGLGVTLFAGVVHDPTLVPVASNLNQWTLKCTDYTYYADNALVQGTYNGLGIDQIVVALTTLADCGITAKTIANGGFVAPAPTLTTYSIGYTKLSGAWRSLAALAGSSTPYGWYVDENRNLHFFDSSTAISSGATVTTTLAASAPSTTEAHVLRDGNFSYEWDGTSIRNRILVQGSTQTVQSPTNGKPTDTWVSNGAQSSWGLRYTPTGAPALKVGGSNPIVALVNAGATSTATWQVKQNANGQWYLITTSVPSSGTVIKLWYNYVVPVTAQVNSTASQATYTGFNKGIYTTFINDSTLTTTSMALARAQREKTEYAFAAERLTFSTGEDFLGWIRAGETFTFNSSLIPDSRSSYSWGINGPFIAVSNSVNFNSGGYRSMGVTAVRI